MPHHHRISPDDASWDRPFSPSQILPDRSVAPGNQPQHQKQQQYNATNFFSKKTNPHTPHPSTTTTATTHNASDHNSNNRLSVVPSDSIWPDFDDNLTNAEDEENYEGESPIDPDHTSQPTNGRYSNQHAMADSDSGSDPSLFDNMDNHGYPQEHITDTTTPQPNSRESSGEDRFGSYDLKPPPPSAPQSNIELLADRLFSVDHLKVIVRDPAFFSRFTNFLNRYRPQSAYLLQKFVETQKAVSAVEYANAVAADVAKGATAAVMREDFEAVADTAIENIVNDSLPGYVTHRLVQIVTETLVKEIIGQNTPIMRELVHGLAETYCLTDPSLPDNPIVYASEEFYNTTQYGRDYVIGRNCRFLQGPRSSPASVQRLIDALADGQEICETILNYRRDGSPFINLLMIAPLYDNKGQVRYFIGAQIDISGLIEGGQGLDSFERLLSKDRSNQRYGGAPRKAPTGALAELSAMWNNEEVEIAKKYGRQRTGSESSTGPGKGRRGAPRRYLGMDDPEDRALWPSPHLGSSGRLPGVFQNYLLIRPYPSLRITFTSPALRIPGLLQSKFLDRIGGPSHIRDGISSALSSGIGVTAKVQWLASQNATSSGFNGPAAPLPNDPLRSNEGSAYGGSSRPGSKAGPHSHQGRGPPSSAYNPNRGGHQQNTGDNDEGKTRWIHCTPLMGSDERVGVWMVVMVENEAITGALNAHQRSAEANERAIASGMVGDAPSNASTTSRGRANNPSQSPQQQQFQAGQHQTGQQYHSNTTSQSPQQPQYQASQHQTGQQQHSNQSSVHNNYTHYNHNNNNNHPSNTSGSAAAPSPQPQPAPSPTSSRHTNTQTHIQPHQPQTQSYSFSPSGYGYAKKPTNKPRPPLFPSQASQQSQQPQQQHQTQQPQPPQQQQQQQNPPEDQQPPRSNPHSHETERSTLLSQAQGNPNPSAHNQNQNTGIGIGTGTGGSGYPGSSRTGAAPSAGGGGPPNANANANGTEKDAAKSAGRGTFGGTIRRKSGGTESHEAKRSRARHLVSKVIGE
ncbi:MAG: hypothetical protein M1831_005754 [Alyxoria varia]|nr:MAG: hypothetical protein M1831_005754 [Alyxoria varia]